MNRLLIVDDNPVDRELARQVVERHTGLQAQFANNGVEAVEQLESATPLAILTDLQMPEMDGLALVRIVRQRFPTIPIVLMTANGSEDTAVQALVEGAADYVPKRQLAKDLPRIIESVLNAASGDHRHEVINSRLCYKQLRYSFESDANLIPPLVDQLQQAASELGIIEQNDRVRLARCLAEALRNAVIHGSPQPTPGSLPDPKSPQIDVSAEYNTVEARFVIRDQGPGFNPKDVVDPRDAPTHLTAQSGRGLALIRLFMDQVTFNDSGNEITLVKRRPFAER